MTAYTSMFEESDRQGLRDLARELLRRRVSSIQDRAKDPNWDPYAPPKAPSMFNQVMPTIASAGGAALGSGLINGGLGLIGLGSGASAAGAGAAGTAGATAAGTAGAGTAGSVGAGVSGAASAALPAAGIAAGAYTGYQQGKGIYDAAKGKDLDLQQQVALALPTFGASFLYNPVKNMFGGGIHPEQKDRNEYAKSQAGKGLTGLDSKAYNIDQTDGKNAEYVGAVNPLAAITTESEKMRSDAAGMMANDNLTRGLDPLQGAREQFALSGFNRDSAYNAVLALPGLDEATRNAYLASIDKTFGVQNPNATS